MAHYLAPEAERDFDDIAYYMARETGSLDIAECLIDPITSRFYLLASHPRIGRAHDDLLGGARSFTCRQLIDCLRPGWRERANPSRGAGRRNLIALFGR